MEEDESKYIEEYPKTTWTEPILVILKRLKIPHSVELTGKQSYYAMANSSKVLQCKLNDNHKKTEDEHRLIKQLTNYLH